jgi:uncharacterized membrane protein
MFYGEPNAQNAYAVVQKYHVTHVVVGGLENRTYGPAGAVSAYPFLLPAVPGSTTVFQVLNLR